jgi:tetratricopeptide (TPR) repeat protein
MNSEEKEENTVPEESATEEETDPNLQEVEEDEATLDKLEKEGGDLAEFDLEAQIEEFRAVLEEEPDNCVHHYNLAEALEELGEREEAKAEY